MGGPTITRFAPSPTGYLHLGHALSARQGFDAAQAAQGQFLLRIEDIDQTRCRPAFEEAILEDLRFLGLHWSGAVRRQSEHLAAYANVLNRLWAEGLLYPCFCTRAEIAEAPSAPQDLPIPSGVGVLPLPSLETIGRRYPGLCRALPSQEAAARIARGDSFALRLDGERALRAAEQRLGRRLTFCDRTHGEINVQMDLLGDVVLGRKEVRTSYHLAVVLDDALQGVTLITRGEDLFYATHVHRVLQVLLNLPEPSYAHHPLLHDHNGGRLAKRRGSQSLRALRQEGLSSQEIWQRLGLTPPVAC